MTHSTRPAETPRTDDVSISRHEIADHGNEYTSADEFVEANFARQLELELAAERERADHCSKQGNIWRERAEKAEREAAVLASAVRSVEYMLDSRWADWAKVNREAITIAERICQK